MSRLLSKDYRPTVVTFYMRQYRIFDYFALWPTATKNLTNNRQLLYKFCYWQWFLFWMLLFDISLTIKFIVNITSLNEVIKVFFIFATALSVMAKHMTVKLMNKSYLELFAWFHDEYLLPRDAEEEKKFDGTLALSRRVRDYYTYLSLTALTPVLLFVDRAEMPVSWYIPFDLDCNWKYLVAYCYQIVAISILCIVNIAFDSLATSCFIYLKGQLNILAYRLQHIDSSERKQTQDGVHEQLKQCIEYYQRLQEIKTRMEHLLNIPISVQIICSVLVLIANFYAMSFLSGADNLVEFTKFLVYQICMLAQIFIMCFYANEVSLSSSELSYAIYASNWFHWNKLNRRLVLLVMLRFDTPMRIRTINRCYSFNLAAFTSIVNSSYSYFALLKKING